VEPSAQSLLRTAMKQLSLSARGFHRILKVARTIADLDGAGTIKTQHLAESIQYRPRSLMQ
jgi:magnesium chelatase family protein